MNYPIYITVFLTFLYLTVQLGGWRETEVDLNANTEFSKRAVEVLTFAIDKMRDDKTIPTTYSFVKIVNLKTQIVAGTNWKLLLALRDFEKNLHHFEVVIWEKLNEPENKFKLTSAIEIPIEEKQPEHEHPVKRELVGGYSAFECNLQDANDICNKVLTAAEPKLRLWAVLGANEAFGPIIEAKRQIVAGTNFKVFLNVSGSDVPEKAIILEVFQPLQNSISEDEEQMEFVAFSVIGKMQRENTALGKYIDFFTAKTRDIDELISFIQRDLPKKYPEFANYTFKSLQNLKKKNVAGSVYSFQAIFSDEAAGTTANFSYSIFVYPPFVGHEMFRVENFQLLSVPPTRVLQAEATGWVPVQVEFSSQETTSTIAKLSESLINQDNIPTGMNLQLFGSFLKSTTSEIRKVTLLYLDGNLDQSSKRIYEVTYEGKTLISYIRKE